MFAIDDRGRAQFGGELLQRARLVGRADFGERERRLFIRIVIVALPVQGYGQREIFRGERNVWTPEDLFVAAIETCLLMTFISIVQKRGLEIDAYSSESTGLLESVDGRYRFTRVILRPTIIVPNQDTIDAAKSAIERAHRDCLVANSLLTTVIVEPDIRLRHAA